MPKRGTDDLVVFLCEPIHRARLFDAVFLSPLAARGVLDAIVCLRRLGVGGGIFFRMVALGGRLGRCLGAKASRVRSRQAASFATFHRGFRS